MLTKKFNFILISLKNTIIPFILCSFIACLILFSTTNIKAAKIGLELWATTVVPSLFPFLFATELLSKTKIVSYLGKLLNKIMRPLFNIPGEGAFAFVMGLISGYPVGAKIVTDFRNKGICSQDEGNRMLAFTNNSGPLFILGTVGIAMLKSPNIGYTLLLSHILASLTVGYLFSFWKKNKFDINFRETKFNSKLAPIKISDFGEILGNAIKKSIFSLLSIGGFIVFFSVILSILETSGILEIISTTLYAFGIPKNISKCFITGVIEMTNGLNFTSNLYNALPNFTLLLISFLLGFGGISVLFQVYSIIAKENISIKPYFYGKILQGFLSVIFTSIFIFL